MEKNKLAGLSKGELIEIINTYQEQIAINEECKDLLRVKTR